MATATKREERTAVPAVVGHLRSVSPTTPLRNFLVQAGEVAWFMIVVAKEALHPRAYWSELRDQMYFVLRTCLFPLVVAWFFVSYQNNAYNILSLLDPVGAPTRMGGVVTQATLRTFTPFVTAIIIGGVAGTAMCADLGARKIREEIDALEVLGIRVIRALVVPRVLAIVLLSGLLTVVGSWVMIIGTYLGGFRISQISRAGYFGSLFSSLTEPEVILVLLKMSLFGFMVGVISCYKGLRTSGGPEGLGKAVNQTVVFLVLAYWAMANVFDAIFMALNPEMGVQK